MLFFGLAVHQTTKRHSYGNIFAVVSIILREVKFWETIIIIIIIIIIVIVSNIVIVIILFMFATRCAF